MKRKLYAVYLVCTVLSAVLEVGGFIAKSAAADSKEEHEKDHAKG